MTFLYFKKYILLSVLLAWQVEAAGAVSNEQAHEHNHDVHEKHDVQTKPEQHTEEHEEHGGVSLSGEQVAMADIHLDTLEPLSLSESVYAPGEIKANGYQSYIVSPRVSSVVVKRHAALGEQVTKDQPLVSLFSEDMITAQSELQNAAVEWQRIRKLGQAAVGEKRYVTARNDYQAASRRLQAFGLSLKTINEIAETPGYPLGEYTLVAQAAGVVMTDDFNQGQQIAPGQALMLVSDESQLWVEARLPAHNDLHLAAGHTASVVVGDIAATATVTQESHTIDPVSRTRTVRLNLNNEAHKFHSGMFADVYFSGPQTSHVLAVQESALMRDADGDWQLFVVDEDGELVPRAVQLGNRYGKWQQISGVEANVRYVSRGAFFVASEIAKGGFDPHNH